METIVLMKKDSPIASFTFDGKLLKKFDIYDSKRLPIGFENPAFPFAGGFRNILTNLNNWLQLRKLPNTRFGYDQIRGKLKLVDTNTILMQNFGLSLNDNYWFINGNDFKRWDDINFYKNKYSREFGDFLFDPKQNRTTTNFITPDFTTAGDDLKRWHQVEDMSSLLIKTNPLNEQVACNEVFASKIASRLNLDFIEYGLLRQRANVYTGEEEGFKQTFSTYKDVDCLCSVCENYCDEDTSYISAQVFLHTLKRPTMIELYKEITKTEKFKKKIDDIIVLDYLIENTDRHLNNFGFLIDNDNNLIDVFPIFDCGNSMNYQDRFKKDDRDYSKMFNKPFIQLADLVFDTRAYDFSALRNIDDLFYKVYEDSNLTDEEKASILRLFKMRVNNLQQYFSHKDKQEFIWQP